MSNSKSSISTTQLTVLILVVIAMFIGLFLFIIRIQVNNKDSDIRTQVKAQQSANMIVKDKVKRILRQQANVTETGLQKFEDIYTKIYDSRYKDENLLMKFVNEQNPTLPTESLNKLMDNVYALESEFALVQKKLTDIKREHDKLLLKEPGCWFLKNKDTLAIVIVTTSSTKQSFATGIDDDLDLLKK